MNSCARYSSTWLGWIALRSIVNLFNYEGGSISILSFLLNVSISKTDTLGSVEFFSSFNRLITVLGDTHISSNSFLMSIWLDPILSMLRATIMQDAMIPLGFLPIVIALYLIDIYILWDIKTIILFSFFNWLNL